MIQSEFERELEQEIYGKRLLVLFEQDGVFNQVLLNPEQFKKVSDAILIEASDPDERGMQECRFIWGTQPIAAAQFEGMRDFYPQAFLDALPEEDGTESP